MNEHLKLQIGKHGTIIDKVIVNGTVEEEYIQGVLRDVEEDIITIDQYIPFADYLLGLKPTKIERKFKLGGTAKFHGVWR